MEYADRESVRARPMNFRMRRIVLLCLEIANSGSSGVGIEATYRMTRVAGIDEGTFKMFIINNMIRHSARWTRVWHRSCSVT